MRINHNISAINAQRQLAANSGATQKSLEKLSSGLRINTAGDDAAGLAISEKMRSQIRGLAKAQSNAQDSISLIQTAEGALQQVSDIMQRMRELAVQSMNGILSDDEKKAISSEMTQLQQEVDRIAETSKFNNTYLLKGTLGMSAVTSSSIFDNGNLIEGVESLDVSAAEQKTTYKLELANTVYGTCKSTATGALEVVADTTATPTTTQIKASAAGAEVGTYVRPVYTPTSEGTAGTNGVLDVVADSASPSSTQIKVSDAGPGATVGGKVKPAKDLQLKYKNAEGNDVTASCTVDISNNISKYTGFLSFVSIKDGVEVDAGIKIQVKDLDLATLDDKEIATSEGGKTNLQIGANSNDRPLRIEIDDLRVAALGIDVLSVNDTDDAKDTLNKIDGALTRLNTARGNLGAYQNRLEYTIQSLAVSEENLTAAESRIRDVDMAKEMVNYTKANILNQTATAMLAQANQNPQSVLQLLQGL